MPYTRSRSKARARRRWMIAGACLAIAAVAGAALYAMVFSRGVIVRVINRTDFPLSDVRIACGGGERGTELLESGENIAWTIRPDGDPDVVLSFDDNKGHRVTHTYLEGKPTRGALYLMVGPDEVKKIDRTK